MISSAGISQSRSQQHPVRPRPLPTPGKVNDGLVLPSQPDTPAISAASSSPIVSSLPPTTTMQGPTETTLEKSLLGLSLDPSPPKRERRLSYIPDSMQETISSLVAHLPTISSLQEQAVDILRVPHTDVEEQVRWIRDVLFLVNRTCASPSAAASSDPQVGPLVVDDDRLLALAHSALQLLLILVPDTPSVGTKVERPIAEALYHRAVLLQSGTFPEYLPENQRKAFRALEASARAGYHAAWFKLGRCYETFDDNKRAKDCFERGVKYEDVSCLYRMGMAYLMGQLGIEVSPTTAVSLLFRAAERSSIAVPQPAYVYGSLLLGDFAHTNAALPPSVFFPYIPMGSTIEQEAQKFIERAAYLHFVPAQYKLGYYYEFARAPYAYDPLLSVQYYTLASDAEPEACLALSKWFLCGSEGVFEKDEFLARTFAERAAGAGLASAEFAVGYYWEVGIGSGKDMRRAKKFYEKAAAQGNTDAADRLASLAQDQAKALSRQDHDMLAEQTLVRRRTQAKQRSDAAGSVRRSGPRENAQTVVELVRKASRMQPRGRKAKNDESGEWIRVGAGQEMAENVPTTGASGGSSGLPDIKENLRRYERVDSSGPSLAPRTVDVRRYSMVDATGTVSGTSTSPLGIVESTPRPQWREHESTAGSMHSAESSTSNQSRLSLPQYTEKKRYSLVDPGPMSRSPSPLPQPGSDGTQTPPRRYDSPSPARGRNWVTSDMGSSVGAGTSTTPVSSGAPAQASLNAEASESTPRRVRYSTFAEMGIQGSKLEEKDCVIM